MILIFIFLNSIDIRRQYEFNKYFSDRNYIINQVQTDKLNYEEQSIVALDEKYKNLSYDGNITIFLNNEEEILIGFWETMPFPDNGSYFIYSSGGEKLIRENIKFIYKVERWKENWYYVMLE